jgi:P27 family predicted phage terminase small subunit
MRGRKPNPARRDNRNLPNAPDALPRCPAHLSAVARKEWRRLAKPLYDMGVLSTTDRAAFAAYCQAWSRWVEAEEQLKKTPALLKTPSGYVQQSPWLAVANKQLEIMGRYMAELGLTPSARNRIASRNPDGFNKEPFVFRVIYEHEDGRLVDAEGKHVTAEEAKGALDRRIM